MKTSTTTQTPLTKRPVCPNERRPFRQFRRLLAIGACLLGAASVQAANQTWTNAPVDGNWANTNNWVGQAAPGVVNVISAGGTLNAVNNDVATFNSPIYNGIGGAGDPIVPDNGTITNSRSRTLGSIIFDTASCGAYVFYSPSPAAKYTDTTPETGILNLCHDGSITMNASVTNSEKFLIPIYIRLPSSTWGYYNFINNSTTPSAVLFVNGVTNDSANTRATTFVLGGSNTGTNTIGALSEGPTDNSGAVQGIIKQGSGTWVLTGASDFLNGGYSSISINNGLLIVEKTNVFGSAPTVSVNTNGILQINGVTLTQPINLNQSGTVRMNGSATINGATIGIATGTTPAVATTSSSDVLALGNTNNMVTGGAVDSVLHITGPGTVQLGWTNNYIGSWSLDEGTLQISGAAGALGSGADLHIAAGATLDVTPITSGSASYSPGTAGISASGTGNTVGGTAATIMADSTGTIDLTAKTISLDYAPTSFTGDSSHPALYVSQGTLSVGGNSFSINNASSTPLGVGTYQLIVQASGSIVSAGSLSLTGVTGSGLAAGTVGNIVVNGSEVDLVVSSYTPKNLVWQGGNPNNNWDINTTLNFLNGGTASVFNNSDNVTFNSAGAANPNVNIVATVAPSSVTVDTSGGNYTFSGSGQIAGATGLNKTGTGTLQLATVNTYGGDTVISNGVLQLGASEAIPSPTVAGGDVEVKGPGTLDLNGFTNTINALIGSGTVDSVSGGTPVLTVGNNNDSGTFAGTIQNSSGALSLAKAGTGVETLSGVNTYSGSTAVHNGTLGIASSQSLPAGNAVVVDGGILDLGANATVSSLAGTIPGTIANNSSSSTSILTINNSAGTNMTYNGHIDDNTGSGGVLGLNILGIGSGQVITIGAPTGTPSLNNYSGGTLISNAFVSVGDDYSANPNSLGTGPITLAGTNHTALAMARAVLGSTAGTSPFDQDIVLAPNTEAQIVTGARPYGFTTGTVSGPASSEMIWNNHYARSDVSGDWTGFYGRIQAGSFTYGHTENDFRLGGGESGFNGFPNARVELMAAGSLMGSYTVYTNEISANMYSVSGGQTYYFGELSGQFGTTIAMGDSTIIVGGLNTDSAFAGEFLSGNLVKDGTGTFTLNGGSEVTTNITLASDGFTYITNIGYGTNMLFYTGSTTVSNGVLRLVVPANPASSTPVTLAASTAVLDATSMGYISNQISGGTTNQFPVTNGIFEVASGQTLQGVGTLKGALLADSGSTFNVGLPTGSFTVTSNVELAGAVTLSVNATGTPTSSELVAPSITVDSGATLVVTNLGPEAHAKFQLFSQAISTNGVTIDLPNLSGTNSWIDNLAVDGSITLVAPPPTPPTPVITGISMSGTTLNITATNGAVNGTYKLLESTNVATPLANWTPVLTNTFDANGNLNLSTNVVNPAVPQDFYILSQ